MSVRHNKTTYMLELQSRDQLGAFMANTAALSVLLVCSHGDAERMETFRSVAAGYATSLFLRFATVDVERIGLTQDDALWSAIHAHLDAHVVMVHSNQSARVIVDGEPSTLKLDLARALP